MKNNLLILSIWLTASFLVMAVPGTSGEVQAHTIDSDQIEWNIPTGTNLRIVLGNWSKTAGWNLIWEAPREYYTRLPV
ncbi:MAG: TcpQ domain-containing protein, partial [Rhodobacteraceae bacterium]|nr:TcpQ domain-containing protein [Paracoccaceae bacterium]